MLSSVLSFCELKAVNLVLVSGRFVLHRTDVVLNLISN